MKKSLFLQTMSRLRDDASGNVAMMFGLTIVPVMLMVGSSIDYGRAVTTRAKLQNATDATALAVGQRGMDQSEAGLLPQARAFLAATLNDPHAQVVSARRETWQGTRTRICVTTASSVPTSVMRMAGVDNVSLNAESCVTSGAASFEIALVLDTSGSMDNGAGGMTKIQALRTAGRNFVDYMYGSQMNNAQVRIAVAPFSWGVAVDPNTSRNAAWVDRNGQSSLHWQGYSENNGRASSRLDIYTWLRGRRNGWDWKGCFESLPYPLNVQDGAPSATNPDSLYIPSMWPDEPDDGWNYVNNYLDDAGGDCGNAHANSHSQAQSRICKYKNPDTRDSYGPNLACSSKPLARLSNNATQIKNYIDGLEANGNTNIHEGVMWGWRTVSPASVFAEAKPYSDADNRKVLVVMTDGMNTWGAVNNTLNGSYYSAYGFFNSTNSAGVNPRLPTQSVAGQSLPNPTTNAEGRAAMDDLTRRACQNARAHGVVIYTIGFTTSTDPIDAAGKQLLKDCAGSLDRYFEATDASSINLVFGQIAQSIGRLRLLE